MRILVLIALVSCVGCAPSGPDWETRMRLPAFVPPPPPPPPPPCSWSLTTKGAVDTLMAARCLGSWRTWGTHPIGECATAIILNSPEPEPLLVDVFRRSPAGGKLYALMGLYLLSPSRFTELLDDFVLPTRETTTSAGCIPARGSSNGLVVILLRGGLPERIAGLARSIGPAVRADSPTIQGTETASAAQQTDEADQTWR